MSQATIEPPAQVDSEANPLVGQIQQLVRRNSRRWKLLTVLEGLGLTISAVLAYLWLVFWLDNVVHLPRSGRVLAGCGLLVGFVVLAVQLVRRRRMLRFSEDQVALAIERRTRGGVQNRLINALQIARSSHAHQAELSRAVIEENVSQIQQLDLEQAVALRPALLRIVVAILLMVAGGVFYYAQPDRFTNAAARILLPFKDVEPLYRTTLVVQPGDVETAGDVALTIEIQGERPAELVLLQDVKGTRSSTAIPVPAGNELVHYTLPAVQQSMRYAVRGGDYTTEFFQITVPTPSHLSLLRCVYHYPEYTGLAAKQTESFAGNLEALRGTRVDLELGLDHPCEEAVLLIERPTDPDGTTKRSDERIELHKLGPTQFTGQLTLDDQSSYRIETRQASRSPHTSKAYVIHVLADQEPQLELGGLEGKTEASVDAVLPLKVAAADDWGLDEVGLFARRMEKDGAALTVDANWQAIETWKADGKPKFERATELMLLSLAAAEGERLDIALRATDRDPHKAGRWTTGVIYHLKVGGEDAAMQLLYEQILRTEAELKQIIAAQRRVLVQSVEWLRKLDGEGALKWDDPKNVQALHAAVLEQSKQQTALREQAGRSARAMVEQAGNLRMSVALLADTEMVRAERIFDSIPSRDQIQAKRSALADLQLTEQRTLTSLQEIADHYVQFRQDWELAHITGFIKMLADRQTALRETSLVNADRPRDKLTEPWQASAARRQEKISELTGLCETALIGLGEKLEDLGSPLSAAFAKAAEEIASDKLNTSLRQAAAHIKGARWTEAAVCQAEASEQLTAIHAALRKAQVDAARETLSAMEEKAKSNIEAQKEIEKLKAGDEKNWLALPEKMPVKDLIQMRDKLDLEGKRGAAEKEAKVTDYVFSEKSVAKLNTPDTGKRQEFDILKLGNSVGAKTSSFPSTSDRESNLVNAPIQEELQDLVGALIEEADEMQAKFETATLNTAFNINEGGEVGKLGGDMNSSAAAATTGNKKPPTRNVGGASRSGRRGARAYGAVVGDESVNRRGRDKVQEGQERVADQAGTIKETMSDDPQNDTSTGVGGKKVESDDTKFSVANVGKWTDDMAKRMGKPQDKNYIVERQDGRMDPRVAEMLRDLASDHEQIIERVKAIRKELKNLYLPTDHLDEILAELNGQLDRLKESPSGELFRLERQTLDKLRGTMRVFNQAYAGFQPSLPREQVVRGRVLDEADRPPPPGYEEAVKRYYKKLSVGDKGENR